MYPIRNSKKKEEKVYAERYEVGKKANKVGKSGRSRLIMHNSQTEQNNEKKTDDNDKETDQ